MRIYEEEFLNTKTNAELNRMLEGIKRNDGNLTVEEQEKNIEILEVHINGGTSLRDESIAADMMAGQADISDMGGN